MVHLLYDTMVEMLTSVMLKFLKYDVVHDAKKDAKQLLKLDTGIVNQLAINYIVIGEATMSALSSMRTEALQQKARLRIRQAFVDITKYLPVLLQDCNKKLYEAVGMSNWDKAKVVQIMLDAATKDYMKIADDNKDSKTER